MRWGFRTNAGHTEEPLKPCSMPGVGTERRVEGRRENTACTVRKVITTFSFSLRTKVQVIYSHKLPPH